MAASHVSASHINHKEYMHGFFTDNMTTSGSGDTKMLHQYINETHTDHRIKIQLATRECIDLAMYVKSATGYVPHSRSQPNAYTTDCTNNDDAMRGKMLSFATSWQTLQICPDQQRNHNRLN